MRRAMLDSRVTQHGKQLLLDGEHLADCRDDAAAQAMAIVLDQAAHGEGPEFLEVEPYNLVAEFFA